MAPVLVRAFALLVGFSQAAPGIFGMSLVILLYLRPQVLWFRIFNDLVDEFVIFIPLAAGARLLLDWEVPQPPNWSYMDAFCLSKKR